MNKNHLTENRQKALLDFLKSNLNPQLSDYKPLYLNDHALGLLSPKFKTLILNDLSHYAKERNQGIYIQTRDWQTMAELLKHTAWNWHQKNIYEGWRDELFDVCDEQQNVLFQLERSAFRPLGLKSHAVHLNAWYFDQNKAMVHWIATRGAKKICPNQLDNIACGGKSAGESALMSIIRESFEEAGIGPEQFSNINTPTTYFSYRKVHRGVHREFLHVYNLKIKTQFQPNNIDGEVSYFQRMHNQEIVTTMLKGNFMLDSIISLLDLWLRSKCIHHNTELAFWLRSLQKYPMNN